MKEFTIRLNEQHLEYLSKVLANRKYSEVAPLIQYINLQLAEQLNKENKE